MRSSHFLPLLLAITGVEPVAVSTEPKHPPSLTEAYFAGPCTFTTTTYAASYSPMFDGQLTQSYCNCQGGMGAGIGYATSASSTTSYCQTGPPPSPWVEIPKPTHKPPMPSPSKPTCYDTFSKNWADSNIMSNAVKAFCNDAASSYKSSDKDFDYAAEKFTYQSTDFTLSLHIPATYDYKFTASDCEKNMASIQNDCDDDPIGNPMSWKYGGRLDFGGVSYTLGILDQRYVSGRCWFKLNEHNAIPDDGVFTNCELFDASGASLYKGESLRVDKGFVASLPPPDQSPAYYDALTITGYYPDQLGGYKLQFTLGDQRWNTGSNTTVPLPDAKPTDPICSLSGNGYTDVQCWVSC